LAPLREKLAKLSKYDGLFFTSPAAAEIFVKERSGTNGFHGNVYALGRRAKSILESAGLDVKSPVAANTAEEMVSGFGEDEFAGKRYLFVRGKRSLRTIPEYLNGRAVVDEVAVYETVTPDIDPAKIAELRMRLSNGEFDLVCFFSPSGLERFAELFGVAARNAKAAAIGTTTADAAKKAGFRVEIVSPRSNADDFAGGLIEYVRQAISLSRK
jgi:uroporphyrinogen-III synthase